MTTCNNDNSDDDELDHQHFYYDMDGEEDDFLA